MYVRVVDICSSVCGVRLPSNSKKNYYYSIFPILLCYSVPIQVKFPSPRSSDISRWGNFIFYRPIG